MIQELWIGTNISGASTGTDLWIGTNNEEVQIARSFRIRIEQIFYPNPDPVEGKFRVRINEIITPNPDPVEGEFRVRIESI